LKDFSVYLADKFSIFLGDLIGDLARTSLRFYSSRHLTYSLGFKVLSGLYKFLTIATFLGELIFAIGLKISLGVLIFSSDFIILCKSAFKIGVISSYAIFVSLKVGMSLSLGLTILLSSESVSNFS
jgi:hypothetical protein